MDNAIFILKILFPAAIIGASVWAIAYYLFYAIRSQVIGKTVWKGIAGSDSVALTFDDGPSPETEALLDVLKAENVKATFFLIGKNVEKYPETARRIVRENHELGNHSFSHPIYLFKSASRVRRELEKTQEIISNTTGIIPKIARPPCGVRSLGYFSAAEDLNLQTIQWSDTGYDWKNLTARQIADHVLKTVQKGSIILLHDGDSAEKSNRMATVESIPIILRELKSKNLRVASLAELIEAPSLEKINLREKTT